MALHPVSRITAPFMGSSSPITPPKVHGHQWTIQSSRSVLGRIAVLAAACLLRPVTATPPNCSELFSAVSRGNADLQEAFVVSNLARGRYLQAAETHCNTTRIFGRPATPQETVFCEEGYPVHLMPVDAWDLELGNCMPLEAEEGDPLDDHQTSLLCYAVVMQEKEAEAEELADAYGDVLSSEMGEICLGGDEEDEGDDEWANVSTDEVVMFFNPSLVSASSELII